MTKHIFVFEDNPDMSVSRLISKQSYNGNNICFTSGNTGIFEKLQSIYNQQDIFIIFYDISPENKILITRYHSLIESIRMEIDNYSENVYLLPVICTEYSVIKALITYGYIDRTLEYALDDLDYERIKKEFRQRTLEKAYKQMLISLDKQFHNINEVDSKDKKDEGSFYRSGNVKLKAEQFWASLPLTYIISDEHKNYLENNGIIKGTEAFEEIEKELNGFFDDVFNKANVKRVYFTLKVLK